jgi:hypothetical protein
LRLPILLITSALVGCPNNNPEQCGPSADGSATGDGLVIGGSAIQTTYGQLSSLEAHDCADPNAPAGVVGLTINGFQVGGTGGLFTGCVPRPDELASGPVSIGSGFEIVDFNGSFGGCMYSFDSSKPTTGTASSHGLCDEGSAGYTLTFDGAVSVDRLCGSAMDIVPITLSGDAIVNGDGLH